MNLLNRFSVIRKWCSSKCKRFLALLCPLILLISVSFFPVSAATHYEDLISNNVVVGEDNIITLSLPVDQMWIETFNLTTGERTSGYASSEYGAFSEFTIGQDQWAVRFRYSFLSLEDIPDGAVFTYRVKIESNGATVTPKMQALIGLTQDNDNSVGYWLTSSYVDCILGGTTENSVALHKNGYPACTVDTYIRGFEALPDLTPYRYRVECLSMEVSFSIKSLAYMQQQSGKTNKLLDEVNKQLEAQGKTMEDILHGTPGMNQDANDAENSTNTSTGNLGSLGDTLAGVNKPQLNAAAGNITGIVSGGVAPAANVLSIVTGNSLIGKMLMLVATLSLAGYVFFGKKGK